MGCCGGKAIHVEAKPVAMALATESKASTSTGTSEMEDVDYREAETKVIGAEADSSEVFVQPPQDNAADEEMPSAALTCCMSV
mmetsp:Transcript_58051/g.108728  ORF Transcript_58051/g.108728 Transcript_58051/m.108728 type:complete len:83 (+) Transcript_58051:71-319(+)